MNDKEDRVVSAIAECWRQIPDVDMLPVGALAKYVGLPSAEVAVILRNLERRGKVNLIASRKHGQLSVLRNNAPSSINQSSHPYSRSKRVKRGRR